MITIMIDDGQRFTSPGTSSERPLRVGSRRSAGAVMQALANAKPDAIFSSLFAADLQKFVAA
jgi:hypothetical protein